MLVILLLAFLVAAAAPLVVRGAGRRAGLVLAVLPLGLFIYLAVVAGTVLSGTPRTESIAWAPSLGAALTFRLDGLSLLFGFLITGIGVFVLVYAGSYLGEKPGVARFYLFLLLFMASMLGLVLADNVVGLFVFWELTSLTSYFLIGFDHDRETARAAALKALLVTGGGGLALLAGLVLLGLAGGSFEISALSAAAPPISAHPYYLGILLLVAAGAFTKSAQVPFHFWLPAAMEAPTPVSAYLHSATMVKAGIYLLARLSPVLGGTDLWFTIVGGVGAATMVTGGVLALYHTDLKRVLAFSTVSALGALTMLLGMGSRIAVEAALVFLLAHALYKGALFLVAGSVDHETGTRHISELGGLRHSMPLTAVAAVLAGTSLAGVGPVLSFIGKERLLEAVLEAERARTLLTAITFASSVLFVAAAALVVVRPFFGARRAPVGHVHEAPVAMWLGPVALASLGLLFGLQPFGIVEAVVASASAVVLGEAAPVHLTLWHGFTFPLALTAASLVTGLLLFAGLPAVTRATRPLERLFAGGPDRWYAAALEGLNVVARAQTRFFQNGYLRYYVATVLLFVLALTAPLLVGGSLAGLRAATPAPPPAETIPVLLIACAGVVAVFTPSRLGAVALLGVVGVGIALVYVMNGAPDLAITQILVETLTVLLFVLVFYRLPRFARMSSGATRARDAVIAVAMGGLMTALILAGHGSDSTRPLSEYFTEQSVPAAHGRNVVNVILVDFRGLDTLGEITVLALAGLGVYALLRLRPRRREDGSCH